jgi:hypothetical protein
MNEEDTDTPADDEDDTDDNDSTVAKTVSHLRSVIETVALISSCLMTYLVVR